MFINFYSSLFYVPEKCEYHCPNMCGKKYTRKHNLNRHLNYECGVEPRFTCDICFKKFTYNGSMKAHKLCVHGVTTNDNDIVVVNHAV